MLESRRQKITSLYESVNEKRHGGEPVTDDEMDDLASYAEEMLDEIIDLENELKQAEDDRDDARDEVADLTRERDDLEEKVRNMEDEA